MSCEIYQYTPELFDLMVDVIPKLCRSKNHTILFFKGAGIPKQYYADLEQAVLRKPDTVKKRDIVRTILERINAQGDNMLRARREVLKRVVEFESFDACWPEDILPAKGLVAEIQRVYKTKDAFTRMNIEREKEAAIRKEEHLRKLEEETQKKQERADIKNQLFKLFSETNPNKRGKELEDILNRLFKSYGILVKEAFTRNGEEGEGIIEQIDGAIYLDGHVHLVEMKWWNKPLGIAEVSPHISRLFLRGEARGIIISYSGYSNAVKAQCKEIISQKIIVLCELYEIVHLLEREEDLKEWLVSKINACILEKKSY